MNETTRIPKSPAAPPNAAQPTAPKDPAARASVAIVGPVERLTSIDAFRGFVMFLMMYEVTHLPRVAEHFPNNAIWQALAYNQSHVEWVGCSLHDMIQPSFSFLVGVALPFSLASRRRRGQSAGTMTLHAIWRALVLILLGVFLRSLGSKETNWTFEDTLTQIGLGYPFLFLLGLRTWRAQLLALVVILVGYWGAWAAYPAPTKDFDFAKVGVPADWDHHPTGFAAHWDKNSGAGAAADTWLLNKFPRHEPFVANSGGYLTLSFIPTLATMLLGLLAGGWLIGDFTPGQRVLWMLGAGVLTLGLGLALHYGGLCPIVKRIWTPSWVLFSGGICFFFMAAFYTVLDWIGWRWMAFPFTVIGMNSIAAYCLAHLIESFIANNIQTHFGQHIFDAFGTEYTYLVRGTAIFLVLWLILLWMYKRKIFLRI